MPIKSQEESISSLQRTRDGNAAASPLNSVFCGQTGGTMVRSMIGILAVVAGTACTPELPDDLPSLVEEMGSNDMTVHALAAQKVVEHYGVDGLLVALQSPLPGARLQAARFLRLHPDPKAVGPLLVASRDPDAHARAWATFALSAFPEAAVRDRLTELLGDPEEMVRRRAQESFEIIEDAAGGELPQNNELQRTRPAQAMEPRR
jgi:hypothetical protein